MDHFHAAQQALASASVAAADAAKKNVVNAYEKASRLNLKVNIKAPIIIVPIDSQAMKVLCLDLGHIKVSNHFTDYFVNERNAVIDEMKLELSDFKLFHAEIGHDETNGIIIKVNNSVFTYFNLFYFHFRGFLNQCSLESYSCSHVVYAEHFEEFIQQLV